MFDIENMGVDMDGASYSVPLPDNYYGSSAQQPTTPTGTGTGYYVDSTAWAAIGGAVDKALNYVLIKDQQKFAAEHGYSATPTPYTPTPQAAAAAANQRLLLLGVLGVGIAFALRK
jgi:hypothetical protein